MATVFSCVASRNKRSRAQSHVGRKSIAVRRQQRAQRAPSSCSPPPGVATDCATRRVAQHSAQSSAQFSTPFGLVSFPARWRKSYPNARERVWMISYFSGRARVLFLILCRAPLGNPVKTRKRVLTISLLRRGARCLRALRQGRLYPNWLELPSGRAGPTSRGREMLRISTLLLCPNLRTVLCSRALGHSERAASTLTGWNCPRAGQAPRPVDGKCCAFPLCCSAQIFAPFAVRAPWEIQSKLASEF